MTDQLAERAPTLVTDPARLSALADYAVLDTPAEAEYDDITQLAAILCETPIALISLIARDRQWFKAGTGFAEDETAIENSICVHAMAEPDLLVIPDLTVDPRTAANPFVTDADPVRFYAGAPLRTPDGQVIGTLCVLDTAPRPNGLTPAQALGLGALAREIMALLELRRMVAQRDAALANEIGERAERVRLAARDAASEAHWRLLFQQSSEGFAVGEVVRDPAGRGIDWRFVDVNPAWSTLTGIARETAVGRRASHVLPHIESTLLLSLVGVAETGTPLSFTERIGAAARWYDGRVFRVGADRFAILFVDVTDRIRAERRQAALLEIGDRLRSLDTIADMTRFTSRVVGEALELSRAGFGRINDVAETIEIEPDWTRPGVPSIAGLHHFKDYGDLLATLLAGDGLVIEDARTDPRTAADPTAMLTAGIAALVNMPVRERGRTVAAFIAHDDRPRVWPADDLQFLRNVADRLESEVVRLDLEARRQILSQELSHRLKNTLAMVQAIASQTLKPVSEREPVAAFDRRLTALAAAHDVLLSKNWASAKLIDVLRSVIEAVGQDDNVRLAGPAVDLSPRAVLSASLMIHELATNAAKYGALSVPAGTVDVRWRVEDRAGRAELTMEWVERGGPSVSVPSQRGFGSRLIGMGLIGTGGVDLRYDPHGLSATMCAPMAELSQA